ncbi:MAG: LLM class flavin-dependent oxidoreductase [Alphaproteobacteria bacterium]|nr:LLM class flavin-dependent oxidoreductase [Alphaproteobacteria bacterium]MBV8407256.1 LLM class flavin-dependent oxidoreductase [Alphaproteobacteria bacterium]
MHPLRFLVLSLSNVPWNELLRRYKHIEALGFDVAGVADHFVDWTNPSGPWFEATTLLGALARETTRIRLAAFVAQIPFRNPALLARQALTLDHMSNGRFELGLGIGLTTDPAYGMMGLPNWPVKERVARFGEYVTVIDRLLANEVSSYKGRFYEVADAVMSPRPVQQPRPPIIIGAMGPVMMKHAARYADVWNSYGTVENFATHLSETRERIRLIDEHCATIGRDPTSLRRSFLMSDAEPRPGGGPFSYYESPEIFAERVERLLELGISEVGVFYPRRADQIPAFEKIAAETIPALKAKYALRPPPQTT